MNVTDSTRTTSAKEPPGRSVVKISGFFLACILTGAAFAGFAGQLLPASKTAPEAGTALSSTVLFYLIAGVAMVSAAGVAFTRNIIYSSLALLGSLVAAGALYVFLSADFLAVAQLLIYVGGVLVLILFAVMLTNRIGEKKETNPRTGVWAGLGLLVALLGVFVAVASRGPWQKSLSPLAPFATVERIGDLFLGEYLLAFEVISVLLVATLVGAVVIARKEIKE